MGSGSKLRKALGAVKDQTSIGLAKVGSNDSLADLEVAIVKATRHEEYPAEERHIQEILSLTCYSHSYISACVSFLSRRLNKTRNWCVALKTLMLIHRLLLDGDPAYEEEIFFATRRGTRLLNMSDFRDASRADSSWDYSAFVRTYSLYLDERLELRMVGRRGKRSAFGTLYINYTRSNNTNLYDHQDQEVEEEENENDQKPQQPQASSDSSSPRKNNKSTPVRDMRIGLIFSRIQHLQQLLERFLACRPTGGAKHNRVVIIALYPTVKESFQLYYDITEILGVLIDRFMELPVSDSVKVYDIFCRVSKQYDELESFYGWCKNVGIARSSEYPEVERITQKKLDLMDEFIRDKSALANSRRFPSIEPKPNSDDEEEEFKNNKEVECAHQQEEEELEEDMNKIKALPPPDHDQEEAISKEDEKKGQQEADLLSLGEDMVSSEEHGNQLALALFDGGEAAPSSGTSPWEAFNDENWETALVQSASHLSNQKATLGGGFDMMLLDGMYCQPPTSTSSHHLNYGSSGSASSVALGSAGRPAAMLALPAPPTSDGNAVSADPFAASLAIAPPSYVHMSEMEKKQRLLVEEQMMWHHYDTDRKLGFAKLRPNNNNNSYNMGGYTRHY